MSCSEEESNAASVLSQMSQIKQNTSDTIEPPGMNVAHQCDVETTSNAVCSVKVFPCEFCGKTFNKSYNLKTHHRVHSGERPYPCPICAHGFANLGDLKRHARTHTGEKPFICEFCNKAFSDFGSHKRHLRLHTGVKPFKCDQCDRQFTRLDSYKNHTRLHSGERPYKCDECQKEFNYLTTYKRHLNIHSGERPFRCDLCGKKFTRMNYLKSHKLNHRKLTLTTKENSARNAEDLGAVEDGGMQAEVTLSGVAEEGETDGDDLIEQVAHALSEGGVQVSVATVVDRNGQPIIIPLDNLGETHTLILNTQNILNHSSADDVNDKDEETVEETLFITQPLFKTTQDSDPRLIYQNVDTIVSVTQDDGNIIVDELKRQNKKRENQQNILQDNIDDVSMTTNHNDVYIAIDPVQTSIQQILVAVNPEAKGT